MNRSTLLKILIFVGIYFGLYISATINHSNLWGDILSPLGGLIAIGLLITVFIKSRPWKKMHLSWLLYIAGISMWVIADIWWAVYDLAFQVNPINDELVNALYSGTNLFFSFAVLIFTFVTIRKWNGLQLILDISAISVSCLYLFWILFLDQQTDLNLIIDAVGWVSALTILVDIITFTGITLWYFSIRKGKPQEFVSMIAFALMAFTLVDLYYYYLEYKEAYIPNSIIDAIYMATFLLIGLAGVWTVSGRETNDVPFDEMTMNIGSRHRGLLILGGPVIMIIAKGFLWKEALIFLLIIFAYETFSTTIQNSIRNIELLRKEKELNTVLEQKIAARTQELLVANTELNTKNEILDFMSNQDTVTRLYNRRFFLKSLENKIVDNPEGNSIALFFIDLDRFKTINDTYGHAAGDRVLIEISRRLERFALENTLLARLGGDEFVLAVQGSMGYEEAEEFAKRVVTACSQSIDINDYLFHVTMSVGISIYPLDAADSASLMKNADIAMYQAKEKGYNLCISYNSTLVQSISRKNEIEIQIRKVDPKQEFTLHYQPQFSLPDNQLVGVEALLRWNSPTIGKVSPAEFIPIAEETDAIIPIGKWVIEEATRQVNEWRKVYSLPGKIGINVSPKQLDKRSFIQDLNTILQTSKINPQWLDIEITEGVAIEGEFRVKEIANLFSGMGVSISIDDFGTGYSSLSMLRTFPFDRIKIAKPLVDAICTEKYDLQIVKSIITLAKSIGIKTIAEGVETQEQYNILVDLGCDEVQGYLLGKPMSADEFEERFLKPTQAAAQNNLPEVIKAIPHPV